MASDSLLNPEPLNPQEENKIRAFILKHRHSKDFIYDQGTDGIGIWTTIKCACGEELDATDYGCW